MAPQYRGQRMPKSVIATVTVGLILSALSVFGNGGAELKELVDSARSYHEACEKRLDVPPKAIDSFRSTLRNVEFALARNRQNTDVASRDKDHLLLQKKLEEALTANLTFYGSGKQADSDPYLVLNREHPKMAAPKTLVEYFAKRILEKLLSPELFVDSGGKVQSLFLFQGVAHQAPIKEALFNVGGEDRSYELRRRLILMLTEKGDEKGLARELAKHDIAFFYFSKMQPFDLYVRTHFPRRYDEVLAGEKTYMNDLIAKATKIAQVEKGIRTSLAADAQLIERVASGRGSAADVGDLKALVKSYQDFMYDVDQLPFRGRATK